MRGLYSSIVVSIRFCVRENCIGGIVEIETVAVQYVLQIETETSSGVLPQLVGLANKPWLGSKAVLDEDKLQAVPHFVCKVMK